MEEMLNGFQSNLKSISNEIQTLQQQSVMMSQRLKNRQAIRGELSQFVDEMVVPEAMIKSVDYAVVLSFDRKGKGGKRERGKWDAE